MKKYLKPIIKVIFLTILLFAIDLICIFTINRPLFYIKENNGDSVNLIYKGLFYNTYNCPEYSTPQIKSKNTKFSCSLIKEELGKVIDIIDTTKSNPNFTCAETLESFYKDNEYTYYYNCIKSKYIIVKYQNGFEETVEIALKEQTITISDLDKYHIEYLKYKNN